VPQGDIAVITPYRQQIKLLSSLFSAELPRVELLTADKAQGRDKDVVLVSLVRSNSGENVGDLLRDWRRINVSFTRARRKLVIFGSRRTLAADRLLSDFFALVDEKGWARALPVNAHRLHPALDPAPEAEAKAVGRATASRSNGTGTGTGNGMENELNVSPSKRSPKRAVVSQRLLNGRPFVREILNEMLDN
jgi:DNA replication ATP-dependent helicase Dna2